MVNDGFTWFHMVSQGYSMVKKWIPIFLSTCDFKIKWLSCKLFHKSNDYDIGAQREFIQQPREFIQSNCSSGHLANYFFLRLDPSMPRNHAFEVSKTSSYHHFIFMSIYICPIIFCVKNLSSPPENTPCCVPLVARGETTPFHHYIWTKWPHRAGRNPRNPKHSTLLDQWDRLHLVRNYPLVI